MCLYVAYSHERVENIATRLVCRRQILQAVGIHRRVVRLPTLWKLWLLTRHVHARQIARI